jgi:hypothetical protein
MKKLSCLVLLILIGSCEASSGKPVISIAYSPTLDSACSVFRGGGIKDTWKKELTSRKPEFESLWQAHGSKLIEATESITHKTFPSGNFTARLTLCNTPSQSMGGITVNMRYALTSYTATPVPMRYKVDTLFHELLHVFLAEHPIKDSVLLKQHQSEPERTRDHLHLLALQKAILLQLNEPEALKSVIATDSLLPGGFYKRAWEIVNATDTEYLKYIAEIQQET